MIRNLPVLRFICRSAKCAFRNLIDGDLNREVHMKSLRMSVVMLVLGISTACSTFAYAQQDMDPDHFDYPNKVGPHVQSSQGQNAKRASSGHHKANTKAASARAGKKDTASAPAIRPSNTVMSAAAGGPQNK
jgi:cytoskeletal protein RodZ